MPYVDAATRLMIDEGLAPTTVGELTYCLTKQCQRFLKQQSRATYEKHALVLGALEGCKADYIERVLRPYEDKKRVENGDVWACGEERPA